MNPKTIVTHPGKAHRDEFLACCVLMANDPSVAAIQRRDPSPDDMESVNTYVLDQGGQCDPARKNYDHHQRPREAAPCCSLSLALEHECGITQNVARDLWPWFGLTEWMDSKGPTATARRYGMSPEALTATHSVVEAGILHMFSEHNTLTPQLAMWDVMTRIGQYMLSYAQSVKERLARLTEGARIELVGDLVVIDARCVDRGDNPTLGLDTFCQMVEFEHRRLVAVTITEDDRGDGLTIYRRNDHPDIDFSVLADTPGVVFAHANGFIAKLASGVDPLPLIAQAVSAQRGA